MRREPSMPQRRRRFEHRAVQSQVAVEVPRAGQPRRGDSRASAAGRHGPELFPFLVRGSALGEDGRAASPRGRSRSHISNPTDRRGTGGGRYFIYRPPPDGKRDDVRLRARAGRRHRWRPRRTDLHRGRSQLPRRTWRS